MKKIILIGIVIALTACSTYTQPKQEVTFAKQIAKEQAELDAWSCGGREKMKNTIKCMEYRGYAVVSIVDLPFNH